MLAAATAAALYMARPQLEGSFLFLLPNGAALLSAALVGSAAAALSGGPSRVRPLWLFSAALFIALGAVHARGASPRVLVSLGSAGLALVLVWVQALCAPLLRSRRAFPEIAMQLLLSAACVTFSLRAVAAWPGNLPLPALSPWGPEYPMLMVSVVFVAGTSLAFFSALHERQREALRESVQRDSLTGLFTRGVFFEKAQAWLEEAPRGAKFAVVMADIDHFKRVNDTYGHVAGDHVIAHAARGLLTTTRLDDLAGRYGGEEFCVLLKNCDEQQAKGFVQRLLRSTDTAVSLRDGRSVAVTFSVGYAYSLNRGGADQLELVLDHADQALFRAKAGGRNRAEEAPPAGSLAQGVQQAS